MKKVLVILTLATLFVAKNTKAQENYQLGFYKTDNHTTAEWKQFMYDGLDGKDLSSYNDWFNTNSAKEAFDIYCGRIKESFPGFDIRDVVNEAAEADLTKDMLHPGSIGYIHRDTRKMDWGNRLTGVHPGEKRLEFRGITFLLPRCGNTYSWTETPDTKRTYVTTKNELGWTTNPGVSMTGAFNSGNSTNTIKIDNSPKFENNFNPTLVLYAPPPEQETEKEVVYHEQSREERREEVTYVTSNNNDNCCQEKYPWGMTFGGQLLSTFGGTFAANTVDHLLFPQKAPQNNYYLVNRRNGNRGNGNGSGNTHYDYSTGNGSAGEYHPRVVTHPIGQDNPNQNHPVIHPPH